MCTTKQFLCRFEKQICCYISTTGPDLAELILKLISVRNRIFFQINGLPYPIRHYFPTHLEIEGNCVNRDIRGSGVILQGSGQEGLWEEETGNPENHGFPLIDPHLNEVHPLDQVLNPGCQRFQRGVGL